MELTKRRFLIVSSAIITLSIILFYLISSNFLEMIYRKEGDEALELPIENSLMGKVVFRIWNESLIYNLYKDKEAGLANYFQYLNRYITNSKDDTTIFWFKDGVIEGIDGSELEPSISTVDPISINLYELGFGTALILSLLKVSDENILVLHSTIIDVNKWDRLLSEIFIGEASTENIGWIIWSVKFDVDSEVVIDGVQERIGSLYIVLEQPMYKVESNTTFEDVFEMMYWSIVARPALSMATRILYDENKIDLVNYVEISRLIVSRLLKNVYPGYRGLNITTCNTPSEYIFNVDGEACYQSGSAATYVLSYGLGVPTAYIDDEYINVPVKPWAFLIAFSKIYNLESVSGIKFLDLDGDGSREVLLPVYGRDIELLPPQADDQLLSGKQVIALDVYRPTIPSFMGLIHSSLVSYLGVEDYLKSLPDEIQTPWTKLYSLVVGGFGSIFIAKAYDVTVDALPGSVDKKWIGETALLPGVFKMGIPSGRGFLVAGEEKPEIVTSMSPTISQVKEFIDSLVSYAIYRCSVVCDSSQFRKPVLKNDYKPLYEVNRLNVTLASFTFKWEGVERQVIPNLIGWGLYEYVNKTIIFSLNADIHRISILIGEEVKNDTSNFVFLNPISPTDIFLYLSNGSVITIKSSGDLGITQTIQTLIVAGEVIFFKDYGLTLQDILGSHLFVYIELDGKQIQFIIAFPNKV